MAFHDATTGQHQPSRIEVETPQRARGLLDQKARITLG